MDAVDITHVTGVKIGEVGWPMDTPIVPMGDLFIPELMQAWIRLPGKGDQPVMRLKLQVRENVPSFTKVEIESKHDGRPVTGKDLLLVKEHLDMWLKTIVELTSQQTERDPARVPDWADAAIARGSLDKARRGAPRKITADRLKQVADIYRAHIEANPLDAIKQAYPGIGHRTAARYVQLARKAGYLPPTTPGKKKA